LLGLKYDRSAAMGFEKGVADAPFGWAIPARNLLAIERILLIEFLRGSAFTFWHDQVCAPAKD
jgi:hypothetical protein